MRFINLSSLAGLFIVGLVVPMFANAEINRRPNTPLMAVKEIDPNWTTISIVAGVGHSNSWDHEKHPAQANDLAAFVCKLYNRTAVSLSLFGGPITHDMLGKPLKLPHPIMKDSYYLFACAIE